MSRIERFSVGIIKTAAGHRRWQVAGRKPDGTRVRLRYSTEAEAVGKKSELEIEALNSADSFRLRRTRLTDENLLEAEAAIQKLNGITLTTAVEFAIKHYRSPIAHVAVKDATEKYLLEKRQSNRRGRTVGEYRKEFARLNAVHGERLVGDIRPDDLRPLIYRTPEQSPVTTNHHIERLHAFFAWCVRNHHGISNPVTFQKATADQKQPEILTNDAVKRLLWAAMNFKGGIMVSYFALSLFTGIRPEELGRLPLHVALEHHEQVINLQGQVAKGRRSRLISVQKNLPAWLKLCPVGPIVGPNFRKHFDAVRAMAGFRVGEHHKDASRPEWTPDVLRHTALSQFFAATNSEEKTAAWGGTSPATLHKHYRRNVKPSAAEDYWSITPQSLEAEMAVLAEAA